MRPHYALLKILLLLMLIFIQGRAYAQNLVPNYSFEMADSCPHKVNCCYPYGTGYNLGCTHWAQGTKASSDYYNACDTAITSWPYTVPNVGVPANRMGWQQAFEGKAYGAGIMYVLGQDYKEYLMAKIPPLEIDTIYEVTIHVSLAEGSMYAVNGFGALFTTYGSPDTSTTSTLPNAPQVDYTSYGIIHDSTNWVKLTKTFIPDSAYQYLIIGVFKNNSGIDTMRTTGKFTSNYYYFDNIIVRKLSSASIAEMNSDLETTIQPNPVGSILSIVSGGIVSDVAIYNVVGSRVFDAKYNSKHVEIYVADLPMGVYTIRINGAQVRRFLKR